MNQKTNKTIIVGMTFGELEPATMITITHTYPSPGELLEAIRAYVREWAHTDEGRRARAEACGGFNWGDLAEWGTVLREKIPGVLDVTCFYPHANARLTAAIVDHDESLMTVAEAVAPGSPRG